jgi:hypothetical protein
LVAEGEPQTFEQVDEEDFAKHLVEALAHTASVDRDATAVNRKVRR